MTDQKWIASPLSEALRKEENLPWIIITDPPYRTELIWPELRAHPMRKWYCASPFGHIYEQDKCVFCFYEMGKVYG